MPFDTVNAAAEAVLENRAHNTGRHNVVPNTGEHDAVAAAMITEDTAALRQVETLEERLARLQDILKARATFEEFGHRRTYRMLQLAYIDALYMLTPVGEKEFIEAARRRQTPTGRGDNVFLALVKIMFGGYDETIRVSYDGLTDLAKWKHNRSAEKWANVFRYMYDNGIKPHMVAATIASYRDAEHGKKLNGIVAADIAAHRKRRVPTADAAITTEADVVLEVNAAPKLIASPQADLPPATNAFASVVKPDFITADSGVVYLVARIENGQLHLLNQIDAVA